MKRLKPAIKEHIILFLTSGMGKFLMQVPLLPQLIADPEIRRREYKYLPHEHSANCWEARTPRHSELLHFYQVPGTVLFSHFSSIYSRVPGGGTVSSLATNNTANVSIHTGTEASYLISDNNKNTHITQKRLKISGSSMKGKHIILKISYRIFRAPKSSFHKDLSPKNNDLI